MDTHRHDGSEVFRSQREFEDRYVFPKAEFFEPNLVDATPPNLESPPIVHQLARDLEALRLLVFGGHKLKEKTLFAKHLAWYLKEKLVKEGKTVSIQQWHPRSGPQNLHDAFDRPKTRTIFIFPEIEPYHLGYDLRRLLDALDSHDQYAIVATDSVLTQWSADRDLTERGIWREYASQHLFDPDYLAEVLRRRLNDARALLPDGLLPESLTVDTPLVVGLSISDAAQRLRTPTRVRSLIAALCSDEAEKESWVRDKVEQLSGDTHAVRQWFQQLDHREQLLALGLAIFDGLFDDQVFAGLEVLVTSAWRNWEPSLSHFDFFELGRVGAYFNGTEGGLAISRIECGSASHRKTLFEVGWELHRRRIVATLSLLVDMVGDSTVGPSRGRQEHDAATLDKLERASQDDDEPTDPPGDLEEEGEEQLLSEEETRLSRWFRHGRVRELFSSASRAAQFRRTASETLSRLGLLSIDAVERALLDLAEDPRRDVQLVAASALARWRAEEPREDNSRRLFKLLQAWQNEARQKEYAQRRRRRGRKVVEPLAHIRSTVALTVSEASFYDPPNRLARPLYKLIERFIEDESHIVRQRFSNQTLPVVVAGHLDQLQDLLWKEALLYPDLLFAIASGMAVAYRLRPEDTLSILEDWQDRGAARPAIEPDELESLRRLGALATVAMAYGRIQASDDRERLTTHQIFQRLQNILDRGDHPLVRRAVFLSAMMQASHSLDHAAPLIQSFLAEVTLEERDFLVESLTTLYLEQRRRLSGGEEVLAVGGFYYPTWPTVRRSLTAIEKVIVDWLHDETEPITQQVALQTLAALTATPLEQLERRRAERRRQIEEEAEEDGEPGATEERSESGTRLRRISLGGRLAVMLASAAAFDARGSLWALFPEYLAHLRTAPPDRLGQLVSHLREAVRNEDGIDWRAIWSAKTLQLFFAKPDEGVNPLLDRLSEGEDSEATARYLHRAATIYRWRWGLSGAVLSVFLFSTLVLSLL